MPDPGELFAHRYRLERELARGGMGSVWVAADERLSRTVAIKFMDPALAGSDELQARFRREASAAGALRTRHVVQVHDFGVEDDTPYIVMEMLEGEDLGARLSRVRRLPLTEAAALGLQIARGLRHAHEAGIVHRDLKPQNLFLCREDDVEIVKILDFGVAKRTGLGAPLGEATSTKQLLGSPQFMSPEQTRARGVDHRSDVWALGVILYRMLTGTLPFQSDHVVDLIIRIQFEPHPPPSSVDPALAPLDAFFARALAKEPDARFSSAAELAEDLARLAAASPSISLTPPPPLAAVPLPITDRTPAPTPAPSGANPLAPSMYGVAPPSLRPGSGSAPRAAGIPVALGVGGVAIATALVAVIALVAIGGDEPSAAASPGGGATPTASGAAAPAPPAAADVPAPAEEPPEPAPVAPAAAPSSSTPAASASAAPSSAPSASASGPVAPRVPAPRPSGEKKLLLTY